VGCWGNRIICVFLSASDQSFCAGAIFDYGRIVFIACRKISSTETGLACRLPACPVVNETSAWVFRCDRPWNVLFQAGWMAKCTQILRKDTLHGLDSQPAAFYCLPIMAFNMACERPGKPGLGTTFRILDVKRCVENCRCCDLAIVRYVFLHIYLAETISRICHGMDACPHDNFCAVYLELGFCPPVASLGFDFHASKLEKQNHSGSCLLVRLGRDVLFANQRER